MLSFKTFFLSLILLLSVVFILSVPIKVQAATFEEQVVSLINAERQKQQLPPYATSDKLFQASLNHNTTMSTCAKTFGVNSCFQHQVSLAGESALLARVKATGYSPQAVAENIAWGYTTPDGMVSGWMGSSGHKANILGSYKDIGCDFLDSNGTYSGMYWTCDFGKSLNTTSTPTVTPTRTPSMITPTPTLKVTATPFPTQRPTLTPTPTVTSSPTKPWWCVYTPTNSLCK